MPYHLVNKTPIDGMQLNEDGSYKADEDKLGMTYAEIDDFIRGDSDKNEEKIMKLHNSSKFKLNLIHLPFYDPRLPINEKLEVYHK
jgi:NH3-dependent NAD+ synthetase